jgi:hypothetical protein
VLLIAGDTLDGLFKSKEVTVEYFDQRHFNKLLKLSGHVPDYIGDEFLTQFKSSEQGSMGLLKQFGKQCIFLQMPQSSTANACYNSSYVHRNGDYLVMSAVLAVFTFMITGQTGLGREDMPLHLVHTRQDDKINALIGTETQIYISGQRKGGIKRGMRLKRAAKLRPGFRSSQPVEENIDEVAIAAPKPNAAAQVSSPNAMLTTHGFHDFLSGSTC